MKGVVKKSRLYVLFIFLFLLLVSVLGYLYKEKFLNCLTKNFSMCIGSRKYTSVNKKFSFRYVKGYPLTYASEEEMNKSGWDGRYTEMVNFSTEFYLNAGGDRLGFVTVEKDVHFKDVREYIAGELSSYKVPPEVEYTKIDNKDAVCLLLKRQPNSFSFPSYGCYVLYQGQLYRIEFIYNDYYHKLPTQYYEQAREIILSTFSFK